MKRLAAIAFLAALPLAVPQATAKAVLASPNSTDQCPPPPAVVAGFLGLAEGQAAQFGELLNQFQMTARGLQEQSAARQRQLGSLLDQPEPDLVAIGQLVLEIHALQQQISRATQSFQGLFAGLLTGEQKEKVRAVTEASQLQPVVGAFVELYLVPSPPALPCPGQ